MPMSMNGQEFVVGQHVLKPQTSGHVVFLERRTVAKIEGDKVFLNGDKLVALRHPDRIWVID